LIEVASDSLGHIGSLVVMAHKGVEGEGVVADQRAHERPRRSANHDLGAIGVPARGQLDGHERGYLIRSPGDPTATQNKSYPGHAYQNRASRLAFVTVCPVFTENESMELRARIDDLLSSWGQIPSDPLLSEHTLLQLGRGNGVYRMAGDPIDSIITLVGDVRGGTGLIEVAGATPEGRRRIWEVSNKEVLALARERHWDPVGLIDRGNAIAPGSPRVGSVVRMTKTLSSPRAGSGESIAEGDLEDVLAVINRAFEGHPENGNWMMSDLKERMEQEWYNPAGFLVDRVDGVVKSFCWTKVHPDGVGEIYLLAVDPAFSGSGLGRALTIRGLDYLGGNAGCSEAIVYTAGGNEAARTLYESVGFGVDRVDHRVLVTSD
jgi:mycothiol synthase